MQSVSIWLVQSFSTNPSSHLEIGPCVFSDSSCLCECSQQLEPKAGVPEGCIRCCIQLQMMGGNSNSPLEASIVKNKLCAPSVPRKNPFHDLVQ